MIEPTHFTYDKFNPGDDLKQGDILQPTQGMRLIFEQVHKHFLDPKYNAFVVVTQSCDLVRREGGRCRSKYINLAVIRPLEDVLFDLLDSTCERVEIGNKVAAGIYMEDSKCRAEQLLMRILNQNEQAKGLFYLHPDVSVRIAIHSVALLQVSIAVRAHEHYEVLVEARSGRLKDQFQSKMGWLIGNLFSRVATPDMPMAQQRELINGFLDLGDQTRNVPRWVDRKIVKEAERAEIGIEGLTREEVVRELERHKPVPSRDIAIQRAVSTVQEVIGKISPTTKEKIMSRLRNDSVFKSACK